MRMRVRLAAVVAVLGLLGTGCSALTDGMYEAPLPGGADVGSDPITVTAEFDDVLDLVPQSSVKLDDVAVGRVTRITLSDDGHRAVARLEIRGDLQLPPNTSARLQQTSLLGEKYVALVRPEAPAQGEPITSGAHLGGDFTDVAAQVEEVLGALSIVLNGGGIGQFQEISQELQAIGEGRTEEIRAFLTETAEFVGILDRRRSAITDAIDGLAELGAALEADRDKVVTALEGLAPGMQVLVEQRPQLTKMMAALDELSTVTLRTLDAAQDDIVEDLRLLEPILTQLEKSGADLPHSLEILLTYPFPDSVLKAIRGDYLNIFVTTNFGDLPAGCSGMGCQWRQQVGGGPAARAGSPSPSVDSESIQPPALLPPPEDSAGDDAAGEPEGGA